jgi:hypothetical protein
MWRAVLVYGLLLLGAVGLFFLIRAWGETLPVVAADGARVGRTAAGRDPLHDVLLALAAVVAAGWLLGRLMVRLGQPPVIGEVLAGILLGPSLLGRLWWASSAATWRRPVRRACRGGRRRRWGC